MKSLHIRDVDETILERLKLLAQLHHRSMQGEIRAILEDAARRAPERAEATVRPLNINTVSTGSGYTTWHRQEIYGDEAR